MLSSIMYPRSSKSWSKLTTTILCWTLLILFVGAVSSLETDSWLNTFELEDDKIEETHMGVDPNLDVRHQNALNREYPSNLQRIKRSPMLGKFIKNLLGDEDEEEQTPRKRKTHKKAKEMKIKDPAFVLKLGGLKPWKKGKKKLKKDGGLAKKDKDEKNKQIPVVEAQKIPIPAVNQQKQNGSALTTMEKPVTGNNTVSNGVSPNNDLQKRIVFDLDKDKSSKNNSKQNDGKARIVVDIKKEVSKEDEKKDQNKAQKKEEKSKKKDRSDVQMKDKKDKKNKDEKKGEKDEKKDKMGESEKKNKTDKISKNEKKDQDSQDSQEGEIPEAEPKIEDAVENTGENKGKNNSDSGKSVVKIAKKKAKDAKKEAKEAKLKAKEAKKEAKLAKKRAKEIKKEVKEAKKKAKEAKKKAKEAKKEAKEAKLKAKEAKKEAKLAKKKVKQAKKEVKEAKKKVKEGNKENDDKEKKKDDKNNDSITKTGSKRPSGADWFKNGEDSIDFDLNTDTDPMEVAASQPVGKTVKERNLESRKKGRRAGAKNKMRNRNLEEVVGDDSDDDDVDDYSVGDGISAIDPLTGKPNDGADQKIKTDSLNEKKKGDSSPTNIGDVKKTDSSIDKKDIPQNNNTIVIGPTKEKGQADKKMDLGSTNLVIQPNNQTKPASSGNSTSNSTTRSPSIILTISKTTTAKPTNLISKNMTEVPSVESKKTSTVPPTVSIKPTKALTTSTPNIPVNIDNLHYLPIHFTNSSTTKSPIKNSTLTKSILPLATDKGKGSSQATKINSSLLTNQPIVIKPNSIFYDARDVTYFLESHAAHSIHDPRAYFTEERITRAMTIIMKELRKMPENLRFAYIVRTLNELGRKIASKLNYLTVEISAILRKTPDDLGNKPDVSMIINTVKNVFESKEDRDPLEESNANLDEMKPIKKLIRNDQEKALIFGQAGKTIADKMAHLLANYVYQALGSRLTNMTQTRRSAAAALFCDALKKGVGDMITQMDKSDKFRVYMDMKDIFKEVIDQVELELKDVFKMANNITDLPKVGRFDAILKDGGESFDDLNPISHKTALIGPYNTFLFTTLGSAERVIKLFGSLISRVPPEAKARWINMYESRFNKEYKHTLSGFVTMQGMPSTKGNSEDSLLDLKNSSLLITPKLPVAREDYDLQKNKIPARCYLAGRRARLYMKRALKHFDQSEKIITRIANKLGKWKTMLVHQSGNEIYRMCLPRVEVGLRSWGINGDPQSDGSATSKFQMKNPLEGLNTMRDPFENGVQLGYRIGAKIGYNEERNATLELEYSGGSGNLTALSDSPASKFIGRAAYRKAATAAAKKAFEISVREGYIIALKVSIRAGLTIPAEAGSKMAALKCVSVAAMTGMEVGGSFADEFLINKEVEAKKREYFIKLGKDQGSLAGMAIGEKIGAFVGRQAAEEAYRRAITRGGKLERAKFHLEEYEAGARMGFEYGVMVGKRIASSPNLDPSAPKMLLLPEPFFSKNSDHENDVDHWEKDLIPPLTEKRLAELEQTRKHVPVYGTLTGSYTVIKETKSLWALTRNTTKTYNLIVKAQGYIIQDVAYLNLNGTVDNMGPLYGSMITRDVFHVSPPTSVQKA